MLLEELTLQEVELALKYLADPNQIEPPQTLQHLSDLEWLTLEVLQSRLELEMRNSSVH
jgi:hypothetical protein